jgi:hypothetical protein
MSTTNLKIDLHKVTFPNGGSLYGDGELYYDGVHVGSYHRVNGNYPPSVTNLAGKSAGFASAKEAVKFLVASKNAKSLGANIFPDGHYILRIHELMVTVSPEPDVLPMVSAKLHYNSMSSTGSSAASKPALSEMVEIDLDKAEIKTKKNLVFVNKDEMIEKIKTAIKEKL